MTDEMMEQIRDTYKEAESAVGIPDGWFVTVETARWVSEAMDGMGTFGFDDELEAIAMPMLVDDSGMAHIIAEHKGPVKQVHAERALSNGLREHPGLKNTGTPTASGDSSGIAPDMTL